MTSTPPQTYISYQYKEININRLKIPTQTMIGMSPSRRKQVVAQEPNPSVVHLTVGKSATSS